MGKLKKGCKFRNLKKKSMDLLSFMSSFKCSKNFPLKINFSDSNFLEIYAVVHYIRGVQIQAGAVCVYVCVWTYIRVL